MNSSFFYRYIFLIYTFSSKILLPPSKILSSCLSDYLALRKLLCYSNDIFYAPNKHNPLRGSPQVDIFQATQKSVLILMGFHLGYICLYQRVHLLYSCNKLTLRQKNSLPSDFWKSKSSIKIQWIFVSLLSHFVIRNFKGTNSFVKKLKGYMVIERLGTPALSYGLVVNIMKTSFAQQSIFSIPLANCMK